MTLLLLIFMPYGCFCGCFTHRLLVRRSFKMIQMTDFFFFFFFKNSFKIILLGSNKYVFLMVLNT